MADWLPELIDDDLSTLLEALEAWEVKDTAGEMVGDVMAMMVTSNDPTARAEMEVHRKKEKMKRDQATAARKERSVMLRAKLITLRDRRRVETSIKKL